MEAIDICAVIVAYNPNLQELNDNLSSLRNQIGHRIIVDNSDGNELGGYLTRLREPITYIPLGKNAGIGKAQNIGLEWAFTNGFDAAILFDQDSLVLDSFVSNLASAYEKLILNDIDVATIGPLIINRDKNSAYVPLVKKGRKLANSNCIEKTEIISSGALIHRKTFEKVGGMSEELFIDSVDFEWCWRAKSRGYRIFVCNDAILEHKVGETDFNFLGLFSLPVSSPLRQYYQFRNFILLLFLPYVPSYWKIRGIALRCIEVFLALFFLDQKLLRFRWMAKGIKDGIAGKSGEAD